MPVSSDKKQHHSKQGQKDEIKSIDLYAALNLRPLPFQQAARDAYANGFSGLVSVPTGNGKTLAVLAGPLERIATQGVLKRQKHRMRILVITPLKALTRDSALAIEDSVSALGLKIEVGQRTGDISSYQKQKQAAAMPEILVTTPESLSLLLARRDASSRFRLLESVIIDEWHALLATKRGTMTELCLARLRHWRPQLQTWALSATIGDPEKATLHATGLTEMSRIGLITQSKQEQIIPLGSFQPGKHLEKSYQHTLNLRMLTPPSARTLPWAGHLGLRIAKALLKELSPETPTLLFTNTRRQAEKWYQHLSELRPDMVDKIALHHGSLDQQKREANEAAAKAGEVVWTVATASLDLGIDYPGIEQVVQIGSPKTIARLIQRAGRAGHRPGALSHLLFVPTHALEIIEFEALQSALANGELEPVNPILAPLDVLSQHLITLACGEGFRPEFLSDELKTTASYKDMDPDSLRQVLEYIRQGGSCLGRYDHYKKVAPDEFGTWRISSRRIAAEHRMQIGTIVSDPQVTVAFSNRRKLGTVEESFVSRLRPGDTFYFAGQLLRFDKFRAETAFVSKAKQGTSLTPAWAGGTLPISSLLSKHLRKVISTANEGILTEKDNNPTNAVLGAQASISCIPCENELLVELLDAPQKLGAARYLFVHSFAGRHVHEGLAALLTLRLGRLQPLSCIVRLNDYGIALETSANYPFEEYMNADLFQIESLDEDLSAALNMDALTKRSFRTVSRIAGLINDGLPGAHRSRRQVQASSELLYKVFIEHEPEHLILREARREVMHTSLDKKRLSDTLTALHQSALQFVHLPMPSPLAFPLLVENHHHTASNESVEDRINRIQRAFNIE